MDNQACRKRDLELWQVLEPSRTKTAQRRNVQTKQNSQGRAQNRNRSRAQIVALESNRNTRKRSRIRANAAALKRRRKWQRRQQIYRCITVTSLVMLCVVLFTAVMFLYRNIQDEMHMGEKTWNDLEQDFFGESMEDSTLLKPKIQEDFLSFSEYNRPGTKLASVKNIFVHYTANPGTTAAQNRSYFEGLGETHERAASAHFIIGCEGEIVQCIPLDEEAYAVIGRNNDSISVECCYVNEDGSFTQATYDSLIHMLAWLVHEYDLDTQDILRHYDSNEKRCPLYYVEHEDEWEKLRYDVKHYVFK